MSLNQRRRGLANALLRAAEDQAARWAQRDLVLHVYEDNKPAVGAWSCQSAKEIHMGGCAFRESERTYADSQVLPEHGWMRCVTDHGALFYGELGTAMGRAWRCVRTAATGGPGDGDLVLTEGLRESDNRNKHLQLQGLAQYHHN